MAKADNKTKPTILSVDAFLAAIEDDGRRADALALRSLLERISGAPAVLWGPSIVGFGACRYRYDSGREGTMPRLGFSPRARESVLYVMDGFSRYDDLRTRLGKHRTGKACLYVKRLADLDLAVLEELLSQSLQQSRDRWPETG